MRQVAVAIETTGLDDADHIIEIAAVEMIDFKPTGKVFNVVINPEVAISSDAQALHGMSSSDVKRYGSFNDVADQFLAFIKDSTFICHYRPFVIEHLDNELTSAGKPPIKDVTEQRIDVWLLDKQVNPLANHHSLDAICMRLGLLNEPRKDRRAVPDARLVGEAAKPLLSQLKVKREREQRTIALIDKHIGPSSRRQSALRGESLFKYFQRTQQPTKSQYNLRPRNTGTR